MTGSLIHLFTGAVLLGMAWRSDDRHTRRIWQWAVWLLGSIAFALGVGTLFVG